jgi:hypothetical protein
LTTDPWWDGPASPTLGIECRAEVPSSVSENGSINTRISNELSGVDDGPEPSLEGPISPLKGKALKIRKGIALFKKIEIKYSRRQEQKKEMQKRMEIYIKKTSRKPYFFFKLKLKRRNRKLHNKISIAKRTRLTVVIIAVPSDPRKRPEVIFTK